MKKNKLFINFISYEKWSEMGENLLALATFADKACDKAHAPYSNFHVGAACLLENGELLSHANFENAAFPMCLCAERALIAAAHAQYPGVPILKMFVTAKSEQSPVQTIVSPCGACRHVLVEVEQVQEQKIEVLCSCETEETIHFESASDLLPFALNKENLP